jgi:hypothetical protein
MGWDGIRLRDRELEAKMAAADSVLRWLPQAVVYPLRGGRWTIILLFGLIFTLFNITGRSGVFGLFTLPALLAWLGLLQRYLFLVVEATSMGNAVPPNLAHEAVPQRGRASMQFLVILMAAGTTLGVWLQLPELTLWVGGFWLLVLPAATLVLIADRRPWAWLLPWVMGQTVVTLGPGYLVAGLAVMGGATLLLADLGLLAILPGVYLVILGHHLLGFQAFHRRDALGLAASFAPEVAAAVAREEQDAQIEQVLDRVHLLAGANRTRDAVKVLETELPVTDDPIHQQTSLLELMLGWRNRELVVWQARRTLRALIDANRASRALALMSRCLASDPGIDLQAPALALALGRQALTEGRSDIVLEILKDQDLRAPGDAAAITGALLYAQVLVDENRADLARPVVQRLLQHTAHPEAEHIRQLAGTIAVSPAPG